MSELEKIYHERYTRWQDKTREQLSFFNNLLLTLSVGFLSFVFANSQYNIMIDLRSENLNFYFFTSIILMSFSIFSGLLVVINRLFDFRITSHINQVRYWFEKKQKNTDKVNLAEKTPEKFCYCTRFYLTIKVLFEKIPRINIEDCEEYHLIYSEIEKKEFNNKFRTLRNYTHNLGLNTWYQLKWQIGLFSLGIICFVISHFSI